MNDRRICGGQRSSIAVDIELSAQRDEILLNGCGGHSGGGRTDSVSYERIPRQPE